MIEYPKIETLYDRDPGTHKVLPDRIRWPEFEIVKYWTITEKVDGTNIRIHLDPSGAVTYGGRTAAAQLPVTLVTWLTENLNADNVRAAFDPDTEVTLFGEGYGEKIQSVGGSYRKGVSFRLFDVLVADRWWLRQNDVKDVAAKLGILPVPDLGFLSKFPQTKDEFVTAMGGIRSLVAQCENPDSGLATEGIVARTDPMLFTRNGHRLMWKLKIKDF